MENVSFSTTCCTLLLLSIPSVYAQQRHHEAHIHGYGQLNIAVDNKILQMELKIPAHDVLGFETITTDKQHQKMEQVLHQFESTGLWKLPVAAGCQLVSAKAIADNGGHSDHHHDHHKEEYGHMDVSATYTYKCQNPEAIDSISTTFFNHFERSQKLAIQSFTSTGQRSGELSKSKPEAAI